MQDEYAALRRFVLVPRTGDKATLISNCTNAMRTVVSRSIFCQLGGTEGAKPLVQLDWLSVYAAACPEYVLEDLYEVGLRLMRKQLEPTATDYEVAGHYSVTGKTFLLCLAPNQFITVFQYRGVDYCFSLLLDEKAVRWTMTLCLSHER